MDQHNFDAHQAEQNNILNDRLLQLFIHHSVSAIFYYYNFSGILLDIGKRLHQNSGFLFWF